MLRVAVVLFAIQLSAGYAQSVTAESKVDHDGLGSVVVTNHSSHPVIAYTFRVEAPTCRPTDKPPLGYRGWDVATTRQRKPIMPGESVVENIGGASCSDGVKAAYAGPLSALFDDGSTFGDTVGIVGIINGRVNQMYRLEQVIAALREAQALNFSAAQIKSRLTATKYDFRKTHPRELAEPPYFDPYSTAMGNLSDSQTSVTSLLEMMDDEKEKLANSKPAMQR